ncbi:MAG: collagen-like protein [Cyclobacteriaceae bacterium]
MKIKALTLLCFIGFIACEGPIGPSGPEGPRGPEGPAGGVEFSSVLEIFEVNFNPDNNYSILFEFPPDEVEFFDAVLVYVLWETLESPDGDIPVWRLMPQTFFLEDGIYQYNFDHTFTDVTIFLEGNQSLDLLPPDYTDNQIFRIVVVPGEFIEPNGRYDFSDYEATIRLFGLENEPIKRIKADEI